MKPCLAFLQNLWVRDPARIQAAFDRDGASFRSYFIKYSLFAGCLTGRRLKMAFGEELLEQIQWEESTPAIAGDPKTIFPADPAHIHAALASHRPAVVMTFGRIAADAVAPLWSGPLIRVPHPAARQPETAAKLKAAAVELDRLLGQVAAVNGGLNVPLATP